MKKLLILFFSMLVILTSCKKLTDFNENTKATGTVTSQTLLSNAEKNLVDQIVTSSVNFNPSRLLMQYWTQTTYLDESNYNYTTRKIPDNEFAVMYRDVLMDLKESKRLVAEELSVVSTPVEKKNKTAIIEILSVFTYQRLVDIFGNVPYDQALDINNVLPAYDDAKTIYKKLFDRLDAAMALIDVTKGGFIPEADIFYGSNMSMWKKFANSLKLKMAIQVAEVNDLSPAAKAAEAVNAGVFKNLSDGAYFKYLTSAPNGNPVWTDIVVTGREDFVIANTFTDTLNALNDPRRAYYMDSNIKDANNNTIYEGGAVGAANAYASSTHANINTVLSANTLGVLMDYTEVQFYLAEAVERGFIPGSVQQYYNNGIQSSFEYWGVPDSAASFYMLQPDVAFPTAKGTNLVKIALQAWIAYYNRGDIAWNTWRRLDAPELKLVPGKTYGDIPVRYTYPVNEQTVNGKNYATAAAAIGGDKVTTKLFWDKN